MRIQNTSASQFAADLQACLDLNHERPHHVIEAARKEAEKASRQQGVCVIHIFFDVAEPACAAHGTEVRSDYERLQLQTFMTDNEEAVERRGFYVARIYCEEVRVLKPIQRLANAA